MIKIPIFCQTFCHGQTHCRKIYENQIVRTINSMAAKAARYSSRYPGSTVYYIPFRMLRQSKIADMGILWANIIHRDNTAADAGMNSRYNGMIFGNTKIFKSFFS